MTRRVKCNSPQEEEQQQEEHEAILDQRSFTQGNKFKNVKKVFEHLQFLPAVPTLPVVLQRSFVWRY